MTRHSAINKKNLIVLVAALGYFVDAYDLILFVVIRKASLLDLHVPITSVSSTGLTLFNIQMIGTLLGGIFFGIMGDKRGRLSVLFGSILVYSLANLANGFVESIWQYSLLRFIAGFGLAGELGAGVTLVAEVMPKDKRGYGTAIVAAAGAAGACTAGLLGDLTPWRISYIIGGCMGLLLLLLRLGTFESALFIKSEKSGTTRGNFPDLFFHPDKFRRYMSCMLISLPIFFVITILMQLAPEITAKLKIDGEVTAGRAVMLVYVGLTAGDLASGLISQWLRNRKKTILLFLAFSLVCCLVHLNTYGISVGALYFSYVVLGFSAGYWITLITLSAEQFGTNLRATVATTIPNFARGAVVPITFAYQGLMSVTQQNLLTSATLTGMLCFILAFTGTFFIRDTFSRDLDFIES